MEAFKAVVARAPALRGFELVALRNWIHRKPLLRRIYQCLPRSWRERMSRRYVDQLVAGARFPALPCVRAAKRPIPAPVHDHGPMAADRGANLFAYFRGEFGLAESARLYAMSLIEAGCPVALNDIDIELQHGFGDRAFAADLVDAAPYRINVIFVNPDYLDAALASIGQAKLKDRYVIACWFWELERVPEAWLPAFAHVDEILVASTFVERAFRDVTDKPVTRIPLPVFRSADSGITRADFGLEPGAFVFLTSFDFHSWVQRKNPYAAIEAFRMAFPGPSAPVRLLIKTSNGVCHPEMLGTLLEMAHADPRILVREGILDSEHLRSLQRCCDAYVSLHRAEGFGLGLAECMGIGKPVIATAWSGNCDFMSRENSCLVSCRLIEVGPGEYLHGEGQRWACPDMAEAAGYMRRLFEEPAFAEAIGRRAAADIARELSPAATAQALIDRFGQISAMRTSAGAARVAEQGRTR